MQTKKYKISFKRKLARSRRRVVRYSLLAANVILLSVVVGLVVKGSNSSAGVSQNSILPASTNSAANPLDKISSADIAVNVAHLAQLDETPAVTNSADSISTQLTITPAQTTVINKPQVIVEASKSIRDLQSYRVKGGDTVPSLATKFGITSDSIRWSNNLTGDTLSVGQVLWIPPVSGVVYTVQRGDTTDSLATHFSTTKSAIIAFNDIEISGLRPGHRIVVPNGSIQAATTVAAANTYYGVTGFAWGSGAVYGYNGYDFGYCTWYVANKRASMGRPLPANLGDAWTWDDRAPLAGLRVDHNPQAGDAVVTESYYPPGHVAYVEGVNADGSVKISEMNVVGWDVVDFRVIPAAQASTLNYIH